MTVSENTEESLDYTKYMFKVCNKDTRMLFKTRQVSLIGKRYITIGMFRITKKRPWKHGFYFNSHFHLR